MAEPPILNSPPKSEILKPSAGPDSFLCAYSKLLPALRDTYQFKEDEIEHFWLHSEVDIEHGGIAYDLITKHCKSREQQDLCVHFVRESAKMRWFHFDGIYLHYEKGYELQPEQKVLN